MKKILFIVGSLRKSSFNMQLAKNVENFIAGKVAVSFMEYADLPFFNQDYEFPTPDSVVRVRNAVMESDGIWIFSPEYNYQIPGVLKNLLDWLSRPLVKGDRQRGSVLKDKPVTISGVAGKSAAAGARKNLSALAQSMSMNLIGGMGTGASLTGEAWSTDMLILSEETIHQLKEQANLFIETL